ncbi:MAG: putative zinc-binding metallopeptidase [Verrucomicrobium sp.]|nr:putative zinc-binding metallopeptidase [Verrucomicrobium sp.]
MKAFKCSCSNTLFFENSHCLQCGLPVGYDMATSTMIPLTKDSPHQWCNNGIQHGVCNWVVPRSPTGSLCFACKFNHLIPNLSAQPGVSAWAKFERAKRRALYSLIQLDLPLQNRAQDPISGLTFDFLVPTPQLPVLTGHLAGVITMNLEEASDSIRERNRELMREPYRTLLGHFRHELAHYYWYLWFEKAPVNPELLSAFRAVFGDETQNYAAALQRHYTSGPLSGWQLSYVSAYATTHPWEDWAETWAHYLHITDALETAREFGMLPATVTAETSFDPATIKLPLPFQAGSPCEFLDMIHRWSALSPALNEISSSLGQQNLYPFVHSTTTVTKLYFVHCMIHHEESRPVVKTAAATFPVAAPLSPPVAAETQSKNLHTSQPEAMRKG